MPYTLTWEDRGVYKRFTGRVSYPEYAQSQEEVLSDPRIDDIRYVINDLLAVDGYSVTTDQVEYLAAFNRGASISNPNLRIAYVTTDAKILLLMRLASSFSAYPLKAFPSVAEAREWVAGKP